MMQATLPTLLYAVAAAADNRHRVRLTAGLDVVDSSSSDEEG